MAECLTRRHTVAQTNHAACPLQRSGLQLRIGRQGLRIASFGFSPAASPKVDIALIEKLRCMRQLGECRQIGTG